MANIRFSLTDLNRSIVAVCSETMHDEPKAVSWTSLSEEKLFFEIIFCICGSQMLYEMALAITIQLQDNGYIEKAIQGGSLNANRQILDRVLSERVQVLRTDGATLQMFPRFKHRLATLISKTEREIYHTGIRLSDLLRNLSATQARQKLIAVVAGFGPKQASLYLRRIGFSDDLAVLDSHVIDYLVIAKRLERPLRTLSCLSTYEAIESEFTLVANRFGHSVGRVDLATWVTMRVAKRDF